jgi:hypothetical protein
MNPMNPMANMNMGGAVGAAAMPNAMNNVMQGNAAPKQDMDKSRTVLNTYIYDYFLREGMFDSARAMLQSDHAINCDHKDSPGRQNGSAAGDDAMDTDNKDDVNPKRPADLPTPNLPVVSDNCFLFEWFCLFWDMLNAQRNKGIPTPIMSQYMNHTQVSMANTAIRASIKLRPDF